MLVGLIQAAEPATLDLGQLATRFPDDAACLKAIMVQNFGGTEIRCPGCDRTTRFYAMTKRRAYACQACGHHIYPCAGTLFHGTRTPLRSLLIALHHLAKAPERTTAADLERTVGVSYKVARRIIKAFRRLGERQTATI